MVCQYNLNPDFLLFQDILLYIVIATLLSLGVQSSTIIVPGFYRPLPFVASLWGDFSIGGTPRA